MKCYFRLTGQPEDVNTIRELIEEDRKGMEVDEGEEEQKNGTKEEK